MVVRLRAVEHAYFLWGKGETKEAAFYQVAEAYDVVFETVNSWDHGPFGLLHHFGTATLKVAQDTAKRSGKQFQRLQLQLHKSDLDNVHIKTCLLTYGQEALSLNAQRFKGLSQDDPE